MPKINTSVIIDKSITKEKLNDELQGKINNIGNLPSLHTNAKDTLVNSINELYNNTVNGKNLVADTIRQKGVSIEGVPSYQQLANAVNELYNRLYNEAVNGKNLVADAIRQKGVNVGDGVPSYQQLYDWIMILNNYTPPDLGIVKVINTLDDWTEHNPNPTKPDDTNGIIDIYIDSILSARLNIIQWDKHHDNDWYLTSVQFFNDKIKRITIEGVVKGFYDSRGDATRAEGATKIIITNKITDDHYKIEYFKNASLIQTNIPIENNYGDLIYTNEVNKTFREYGRKVMRGFTINID